MCVICVVEVTLEVTRKSHQDYVPLHDCLMDCLLQIRHKTLLEVTLDHGH